MPFNPEAVRTLMNRADLGFTELAKELGVQDVTVRNYVSGKSQPTLRGLDTLYKVAAAHGYEGLRFYNQPSTRRK